MASTLPPGTTESSGLFAHARHDIPAGAVVFLVAVPLCLGIAQASGAPLLSGLVAGIVGGLVVPWISRSQLSVCGPAAGLVVLVAAAITQLGFRSFLAAVCVAGVFQILLGTLRTGLIAHFFPASVIKGMLAAIGILIVLKQLPHAVGFDADFEGDEAFLERNGHSTLTDLADSLRQFSLGAILVSLACVAVALSWPLLAKRFPRLALIPAQLLVVITGAVLAQAFVDTPLRIAHEHFVRLPLFRSLGDLTSAIVLPDFSSFFSPQVLKHGATIGIVASLETLLSVEAIDRVDPQKRITPPNRELIAQGVGNLGSALLGGLPITSVIVRSSANLHAGGRTRLSAMVHGVLILLGLVAFGGALNKVPLAALAIVLILVGLKLCSPALFKLMWKSGTGQFIPFITTVIAIVRTDLLTGTLIGMAVGIFFMIRSQQENAIIFTRQDNLYLLTLVKDVTFLQKARIKELLRTIPKDAIVTIDRRRISYVDQDIEEIFDEFAAEAPVRRIDFEQHFEAGGEARRQKRLKLRSEAHG